MRSQRVPDRSTSPSTRSTRTWQHHPRRVRPRCPVAPGVPAHRVLDRQAVTLDADPALEGEPPPSVHLAQQRRPTAFGVGDLAAPAVGDDAGHDRVLAPGEADRYDVRPAIGTDGRECRHVALAQERCRRRRQCPRVHRHGARARREPSRPCARATRRPRWRQRDETRSPTRGYACAASRCAAPRTP